MGLCALFVVFALVVGGWANFWIFVFGVDADQLPFFAQPGPLTVEAAFHGRSLFFFCSHCSAVRSRALGAEPA